MIVVIFGGNDQKLIPSIEYALRPSLRGPVSFPVIFLPVDRGSGKW